MSDQLTIAMAQVDCFVGDIPGNAERVLEAARRAREEHSADLVVLPELTLSGYPPEDLLFHRGVHRRIEQSLDRLRREVSGIAVVVGFPEYADGVIYNSAVVFAGGVELGRYRKCKLPNYGVFDEKRYFETGCEPCVVELKGYRVGITICEDVWVKGPAEECARAGADLLVNLNASPFEIDKQSKRESVVGDRARVAGLPIVYVNVVGGQDELIFDGSSMCFGADGTLCTRAPAFRDGLYPVRFERTRTGVAAALGELSPQPPNDELVYAALVRGVRDYVDKHGFPGVVIGLSGGVDSALTLALAADALGAEKARAVMMPSRYTSQMSLADAKEQAGHLGVRYDVIPIEPVFEATLGVLEEQFAGLAPDTTEENIQARVRGMILMAISNKTGRLVLTTGNKSEMAVGYATLYGDMAGGFAPIKDCSKTLVYRLAALRNAREPVIPQTVLSREPSAELGPDQKDSDSLPPYSELDPILAAFIEDDLSVDDIVARGFERATVIRVLELVKRAEYKRRQAPPGIRISRRAFGRDWRYPITSGYRP